MCRTYDDPTHPCIKCGSIKKYKSCNRCADCARTKAIEKRRLEQAGRPRILPKPPEYVTGTSWQII